jgi:hypothetical protein
MEERGYLDTLLELAKNDKNLMDKRIWNSLQYLLPLWSILSTIYISNQMYQFTSSWLWIVSSMCSFLVFSFWYYRISKQIKILAKRETEIYYGISGTPYYWKILTPIIIGLFFGVIFWFINYGIAYGVATIILKIFK